MSENSLIPAPSGGTEPYRGSMRPGMDAYPPAGHAHASTANPMRMVHLFFRGRYLVLTILLAVLTPLGTWIGYKCGRTQYRSVGLIQVHPTGEKILFASDENAPTPMFDAFMDAQVARMRSQRVLNVSSLDPEWKQCPAPLPADWTTLLAEELVVSHQGQMLNIAVWDAGRDRAMYAVRTVVRAYQQIYDDNQAAIDAARTQKLDDRKLGLTSDVDTLTTQIMNLAASTGYGTDDLSEIYEQKFAELSQLKKQLAVESQQMGLNTVGGAGGYQGNLTPEAEEEGIARVDEHMMNELRTRDQLKDQLRIQLIDLGPKNYQVMNTQARLDVCEQDIEQIKTDFEKSHGMAPGGGPANGRPGVAAANPSTRPDQLAPLKAAIEKSGAELAEIGREKLTLDDLKAQKGQKEADLKVTLQRIDELNTESDSTLSARLEVVSDGDRPVRSTDIKDTHIAIAALGGGLGFCLSVLVVSTMSLRDRRLHGPEDTQYSAVRVPMLGMVPTLSGNLSNPEQAAMAAHFVHGIRAMLQIKANGDRGRVLAITSPSAHNGKTSLSLALGVSFAGAHSRTLLIDCDFIGRALSSRVNAVARPRLGRILRHQGLVDDHLLQEGLDQAHRQGKRLGEVLLEMGCLPAEKLESALAAQKNAAFGVLEAIDGEDLAECVATTDIPGLSILPLGQANAEHIGSLSPAMLREVLESARNNYDMVIVDTGPILGSLEAAMVATQADDVVVVLSAGENRGAAERSLRYLDGVGAKVAGFVFNRATPRDFENSDSAQRVSSSANRWGHARSWTQSRQLANFGPVAQAVARSVGDISSSQTGAGGNGNGNGNGKGSSNGHDKKGASDPS
jgi:polysaccharide biosynthesis transport protein